MSRPLTYDRLIHFRAPAHLAETIRQEATQRGMTASEYLRRLATRETDTDREQSQ